MPGIVGDLRRSGWRRPRPPASATVHRRRRRRRYFAAALEPSASVLEGLADLPALAGRRTVVDNLAGALVRLAELQERVIPLEIAVLSDPELAAQRRSAAAAAGGILAGPPRAIAVYLREEQRQGRIRPELDPDEVAVLLLATLFGLAVTANMTGRAIEGVRIETAVRTFVEGIAQR